MIQEQGGPGFELVIRRRTATRRGVRRSQGRARPPPGPRHARRLLGAVRQPRRRAGGGGVLPRLQPPHPRRRRRRPPARSSPPQPPQQIDLVYGLDINPRVIKIEWINLYLNALDDDGLPIYDREGKPLLDRVEFHESDLLFYCRDNKIELDSIVGCIPQILKPNPEAMSKIVTENLSEEFLYSLSSYYALQTLESCGWDVVGCHGGISMLAKPTAYIGKLFKMDSFEGELDGCNIREALLRSTGLCISSSKWTGIPEYFIIRFR